MSGGPIVIDPTSFTTWEEAVKLWNFARRYDIISGEDYAAPSNPEDYQHLLNLVNTWLEANTGGALSWGSTFPKVAESTRMLMAVGATDPANVGTISSQPLSDLVTTGGSIGTVIATTGSGSFNFVKKAIAAVTALSLLATTLFVAEISEADKEEVESALDDFADDDGNILCYTDENGTTHLPSGVIEAVRQKLIEMGAYQVEDDPETLPAGTYTPTNSYLDFESWLNIFVDKWSIGDNNPFDRFGFTAEDYYDLIIDWFTTNNLDIADYVYCGNAEQTTGRLLLLKKNTSYSIVHSQTGSNTPPNDKYYFDIDNSQVINKSAVSIALTNRYSGGTYYPIIEYKTPYASTYGYFPNKGLNPTSDTAGNSVVFDPNEYASVCFRSFDVVQGGGVPGISIQEDATLPTDTTKTLAELYPDWFANKQTFKGVIVDDNNNPQSVTDVDFVPATFKDVQGFNADSTQTQAEAQDGTAPTSNDVTDVLIKAIEEFYEKLKNDPTIPTPTIPAGDSGDTPPAEPPLISASANGLWDIYNPTLANVQAFGSWLWSSSIIDQITRMFSSPIDAVIGFHMIYCTPIRGSAKNIMCGYLDSGVESQYTVANQYVTIDCGTVDVPEYYGTVLDYVNTKLALYLPFIGIVPLSTAVCMGASIKVIYRVDVLTGTCLAQVKVIKQNSDAVMYTFPGNCAVQIPLTATTYTGTVGALIGVANTAISAIMDNPYGVISGVKQTLAGAVEGAGTGGVRQSGGLGSNAGALGIRIPYLIITHPVAYNALDYNAQYGYPINETVNLGTLTGYTRIKDIHLTGIPCTDDELEQIERLLKEGVIFASGDAPVPPVPDRYRLGDKLITANGTYSASEDGYYGYRDVTADLYIPPEIDLDPITISENGTYEAGVNRGYDTVVVNVPVTPVGVNRFSWDFTQSETDSVQGRTAVFSNITRDSNGALLTGTNSRINLGNGIVAPGTTIEIELGDGNMATNGSHQRCFMYSDDSGIIYRSNDKWSAYFNSWATDSSLTDIKEFNNSTVKIYIDYNGYWHVYKDDVLVYEPNVTTSSRISFTTPFYIGASSQSIPNLLVKKITVY